MYEVGAVPSWMFDNSTYTFGPETASQAKYVVREYDYQTSARIGINLIPELPEKVQSVSGMAIWVEIRDGKHILCKAEDFCRHREQASEGLYVTIVPDPSYFDLDYIWHATLELK